MKNAYLMLGTAVLALRLVSLLAPPVSAASPNETHESRFESTAASDSMSTDEFPLYRPGYVVIADVLADVHYPAVADSAQIAEIETELALTGRALPDLWRDALTHPVGVQALKLDLAASVLWVARCGVTETNYEHELAAVMSVIRRRKETSYRGETEYRTVILDKSQFSHFNSAKGRAEMEGVGYHSTRPGFQKALKIAFRVITAPEPDVLVDAQTLHYYSSVSMKPSYSSYCRRSHLKAETAKLGRAHPTWAHDGRLALVAKNPERFRFISGAP